MTLAVLLIALLNAGIAAGILGLLIVRVAQCERVAAWCGGRASPHQTVTSQDEYRPQTSRSGQRTTTTRGDHQ